MHAILFFRKQMWIQSRRALHEQPDIHARLMSKYKQGKLWFYMFPSSTYEKSIWSVPDWWYLGIFLTMFILGVISIEVWPTYVCCALHSLGTSNRHLLDREMPVWAFLLALVIGPCISPSVLVTTRQLHPF